MSESIENSEKLDFKAYRKQADQALEAEDKNALQEAVEGLLTTANTVEEATKIIDYVEEGTDQDIKAHDLIDVLKAKESPAGMPHRGISPTE